MRRMTIGEAADAAGVSAKAIRVWEARGLLPHVQRTPAGYRLFDDSDVAVMRFVRQARALGMTLRDIRRIVDLHQAGMTPCACVTHVLDERIGQIDQTINDLTQLRHTMITARQRAADSGQGIRAQVCPIIEGQTTVAGEP